MSLVWLPLSASADISPSSKDKEVCHEMSLAMLMSTPGSDMSDHSGHSAMTNQPTVIDNAMHQSMKQKGCCDQCADSCVACVGMTPCGHSPNHVSAFILFNQYSSQYLSLIQFSTQYFVQYHNQIITPDIRPPIV